MRSTIALMTLVAQRAGAIVLTGFVVSVAARGQQTTKAEAGEQIMNTACLTCHDNRPVDTQALDEAAWTKEVKAKIEKGAEVKAADVPVLVD